MAQEMGSSRSVFAKRFVEVTGVTPQRYVLALRMRLAEQWFRRDKLAIDTAARHGAGLVTTEKDWARLPPAWRARVTAWPVQAVFEDESALDALLASVV